MPAAVPDEIRAACLATLDRFMDALNAHDAAAMDREMHFPHVRLAGGTVTVYDAPGRNDYDPDECGGGPSTDDFVVAGRDYVTGTARPGWAPFAYPHPLRAGR